MATTTRVSVEEYLSTVYEPDVDYLDGELEERNVGEYDHNAVQRAVLFWFFTRSKGWGLRAVQEQRTKLNATRYRVPDVSVFRRDMPVEQIFTYPQLIAIEVLSPEDRHSRMQRRIEDYQQFGVSNIWIIDPRLREGWNCSSGDWVRTERFEVAGTPIYMSLAELFRELDEAEA